MPEINPLSENPPYRKGVFPVPNALVDALLPTLKDTELRVLLVVLRQTWGWTDPGTGRPKERDRLTHGRLRRDTGRAGEAVSAAVDALVRRGLVVAEDEEGMALATPAQRRRAGSLYFLPGPALAGFKTSGRARSEDGKAAYLKDRKTEVRKPKTTKDNSDKNICPLRKSDRAGTLFIAHEVTRSETLTAEQILSIEDTRAQIRTRLACIRSVTSRPNLRNRMDLET